MLQQRRDFMRGLSALLAVVSTPRPGLAADQANDRTKAMLVGSLIGDAMGGPVEFLDRGRTLKILPNTRKWESERALTDRDLERLGQSLKLLSYEDLRPETAPYGPWVPRAPAGTITDDSRHKIVLMRALRSVEQRPDRSLQPADLARSFIDFVPRQNESMTPELARLVDEGLQEYRFAARWLLGERDEQQALPIERLWAGVSNCSGQMALLPLAGMFPGDPEAAYRSTFELDFIDAPIARDICSALNAGLAAVLGEAADSMSTRERWDLLLKTMRSTDPYQHRKVPFAGRQLDRWLDLADSIVERSDGRPAEAFRLLETEGRPVYYWDAHFTLLVPLTILRLCDFHPLAAMHLTLDFGHDSDSYAQVLGTMAGAVHGMTIWREEWVTPVAERLMEDYGESVDLWVSTLEKQRTS